MRFRLGARASRGWTVPDLVSITRRFRPRLGPAGAQVAQLVEHVTENHGVGGSIPPLGTMTNVEHFQRVPLPTRPFEVMG